MNALTPTTQFARLDSSRTDSRQRAGLGLLGIGVATVLGSALQLRAVRRSPRGKFALGATALTLGLLAAARLLSADRKRSRSRELRIDQRITIRRSPSEVYAYWRDLTHLPAFMAHLESVSGAGNLSNWRAKPIRGRSIEWQAEITAERAGECLAWRSLPGAAIPKRGSVQFSKAPGGRGTEVHLHLEYEPPGGAIGAAFARLLGPLPALQVEADLRRLKQILETGEVMHSDASIHRGLHPARPMHGKFSGKAGS